VFNAFSRDRKDLMRTPTLVGESVSHWRQRTTRGTAQARREALAQLLTLVLERRPLPEPEASACAALATASLRHSWWAVRSHSVAILSALLAARWSVFLGPALETRVRPVELDPLATRVTKTLGSVTQDVDPVIRGNACRAIGELAVPNKGALRALLRCARDPDADCRGHAVVALGQIGPLPEHVVEIVTKIAANPADAQHVRAFAIGVLARQPRQARVEAALRQISRDRRSGPKLRLLANGGIKRHAEGREGRRVGG